MSSIYIVCEKFLAQENTNNELEIIGLEATSVLDCLLKALLVLCLNLGSNGFLVRKKRQRYVTLYVVADLSFRLEKFYNFSVTYVNENLKY